MTCISASNTSCTSQRTASYTSFDKIAQATTGGDSLALTYDPEHARVQECVPACSSPTTTTLYLNDPVAGVMNELVTTGASFTWNAFLLVDGEIVGEQFAPHSGTTSMYYFVLDNLGSVAVTTDSTGSATTAVHQSYDPWGKMRNWSDGSDDTACSLPNASLFSRGFTGQEQMGKAVSSMCAMANYNARIYDPQLGRFMSADPTISNVYAFPELDRYGYVGNDPLSLTDPTGLCFAGCFWHSQAFRVGVAIAVAAVLSEVALPSLELGGLASAQQISSIPLQVLNTGIAGGASGAVSTGRLQGALMGSAQALAFYNVGGGLQDINGDIPLIATTADTFVGHGIVGGLFSIGQKGGFTSGFLAAGVGSLADGIDTGDDWVMGTAVHAVAGGLGSVAGGGKFLNGAESGVFGYLFNACMHGSCSSQNGTGDTLGNAWTSFYDDFLAEPVNDISELVNNPSEIPGAISDTLMGVAPALGEAATLANGAAAVDQEVAAPYSLWDPEVTVKGAAELNVQTDVGAAQFQSNLMANGYSVTQSGTSVNGAYSVLSNGESTYSIYTRTSTGTFGAQYIGPNGIVKYTLGGP